MHRGLAKEKKYLPDVQKEFPREVLKFQIINSFTFIEDLIADNIISE